MINRLYFLQLYLQHVSLFMKVSYYWKSYLERLELVRVKGRFSRLLADRSCVLVVVNTTRYTETSKSSKQKTITAAAALGFRLRSKRTRLLITRLATTNPKRGTTEYST